MACTRTSQPSLDDLFSSSTLSASSATHSTHSYHQPSSTPPPPTHSSSSYPAHALSAFSSSAASAAVLSPAALHALLATKQKELSDITTLQSTALTAHLATVTQSYEALRSSYSTLKQDFLYNLNLLNERDAELTQLEADDFARQRRDEDRERECAALRSEVKVRVVRDRERGEEERLRRVELTASYETKLVVISEELGKLRMAVEEEKARGDRRVEVVREEAERERREVQRMYEARLGEEQRARMEDKERLDDTIDHKDRDRRRAEEAMQALAADKDEQHNQLTALQVEKKEADRLCRQLRQQLDDSHEQLAVLQQRLSEVHDSSDTRYGQLLRERDDALEEWKAVTVRAEEERAEREKERAEEVERRRVALTAERQREEERAAEWRRRLEEKVEEAEAERRERRKVEYETVMTRQQADAERDALETRLDQLQQEKERTEQEWRREVWRLTEEVKERRERMERLQREKEQRRDELILLKTAVDEYRERDEEWTRVQADWQRQTGELEEERRRNQELEEEVVRLRAELQRKQEAEDARPAFAVHLTDEHGQRQLHMQRRPHRPTSISTAARQQLQPSQQHASDFSPAFSDDLGPVSLPSSQPSTPHAAATASSSTQVEQLQAENASLRAAIDTMRHEMKWVEAEVNERTGQETKEVERLRRECEWAQQEREEWRLERERLLDISNRLKAELRRKQVAVPVQDEKEQDVEERVGSSVVDWSVRGEKGRGTVGDINRVRQALNGLIHSNQQLSDNIKTLSAAPRSPLASTYSGLPPPRSPPRDRGPLHPHPPPAASVSALPAPSYVSPRAHPPVPPSFSAAVSPASDISTTTAAAVAAAAPQSAPSVAPRDPHRRQSALRRLHSAELALSSAAALSAEVERLSPRSEDQSPRSTSPFRTTVPPSGSPVRDRLRLLGKRAALAHRDSGGRDTAVRGNAPGSGQASVHVRKGRATPSAVRSRMNLTGKVRNYADGL